MSTQSGPDPDTGTPAGQVPRARRPGRQGWRDPRLWVGVVIVAASVVVGARVLASADDTVAVWAVADTGVPGDRLSAGDLVSERVHFADGADLDRYYRVDDRLPDDLTLAQGVGAGDLLPRSAVGTPQGSARTAEVSITVDPQLLPTTVVRGSHVDVYLTGEATGAAGQDPSSTSSGGTGSQTGPALSDVTVVDVPPASDSFGTSGDRQVVLAVPVDDVAGFYARQSALSNPTVSIVARP